jgi:hypothetical protein
MRKETYENKLVELLGLHHLKKPEPEQPKQQKRGRGKKSVLPVGVTLDEIESYRGAQALDLFLQAPELFSARHCKREKCQEPFLVSRQLVAFCSYTCMKKDLEERYGIEWSPTNEINEQFIRRQWNGNEPLIVPPAAVKLLQELTNAHAGEDDSRNSLST